MRRVPRGDLIDDSRRVGGPIRGCEGESIIGAGIEWVRLNGDAIEPVAVDTKVESVDSDKPVRRRHYLGGDGHPGVISVNEEFCLGASGANRDGCGAELVEDSVLSLALLLEDARPAGLGEVLQPRSGLFPKPEELVRRVVRSTCGRENEDESDNGVSQLILHANLRGSFSYLGSLVKVTGGEFLSLFTINLYLNVLYEFPIYSGINYSGIISPPPPGLDPDSDLEPERSSGSAGAFLSRYQSIPRILNYIKQLCRTSHEKHMHVIAHNLLKPCFYIWSGLTDMEKASLQPSVTHL